RAFSARPAALGRAPAPDARRRVRQVDRARPLGEELMPQAATLEAPVVNEERPAARPTQLKLNLATIAVLTSRDLRRFFRQKSRVVGALVQPLIFWLVIGSGLAGSFRLQGDSQVGYVKYFFPGIVMLVVLFTSIFTTMSVIEDRHKGF